MQRQRSYVIYGAGGHGREVLGALVARGQAPVRGWLDDDPALHGHEIDGLPVLGGVDWLRSAPADCFVALGAGLPVAKARMSARLAALGIDPATVVHPAATVGARVEVGAGCYIGAGAVVTEDVTLGRCVTVNVHASVSHDCVVGDCCSLAPGARLAGNVTLAAGVELGLNAGVIPGVAIGAWTIVGAGATVVRDLPADVTAVGTPARVVKTRAAGWQLPAPVDATS